MAALEVFVRTQPLSAADDYVMISAEWDDRLVETCLLSDLPRDWRASPATAHTVALGDRWIREARSAVLAVPSTIIPTETNFLVNPAHPDFRRIRISVAVHSSSIRACCIGSYAGVK